MQALEDLHRRAGRPSLRRIEVLHEAAEGGLKKFSYGSVNTLFTKSTVRVPRWPVVEGVVTVLASLARGVDVEESLDRFHGLWVDADQQPFAQVTITRVEPAPDSLVTREELERQAVVMRHRQRRRPIHELPPGTLRKLLETLDALIEEARLTPNRIARETGATPQTLEALLYGLSIPPAGLFAQIVRIISGTDAAAPEYLREIYDAALIDAERSQRVQDAYTPPEAASKETSQTSKRRSSRTLSRKRTAFTDHLQLMIETAGSPDDPELLDMSGLNARNLDDLRTGRRLFTAGVIGILINNLARRYSDTQQGVQDLTEAYRLWEIAAEEEFAVNRRAE
jgi:hypothetical protein